MRPSPTMRESLSCIFSILCIVALIETNAFAFRAVPGAHGSPLLGQLQQPKTMLTAVPSNGLIDYIGRTVPTDSTVPRWSTDEMTFSAPTDKMIFSTKVNLFRQLPWKKIKGKVILKAKISGTLPLEGSSSGGPFGFGGSPDLEPVDSLQDFQNLLSYASVDPRVEAIVLEIGSLNCGYAKLQEARRMMAFYRQSGKKIIGYCSGGAEKELYFSLGCDEFYIPPDGGLDIRGFSAAATFVRGVFDKIGIEPQVQRIGKYKSFGDTFNRNNISEAQREVISSLLMEASDFWADSVALSLNKTAAQIMQVWADEGIKTPYDYKEIGFVSGVKYLDQVEDMVRASYGTSKAESTESEKTVVDYSKDYSLENEFIDNPRRKSRDASDIPDVVKSILQKDIDDKDKLVEVFMKEDEEKHQVDFKQLMSIIANPVAKRDNSTDTLKKIEFISRMKMIFSKNLFLGNNDMRKIELQISGASLVGNDNDNAFINLNINNMTAEMNERCMTTNSRINEALSVLIERYSASLRKEQSDIEQKAKTQKRKEQSNQGKFFPAGLYLKKMRKGNRILTGLALKEVRGGPRIAVINAVGGIGSGKSGNGVNGKSLGSDTLIAQVRQARRDSQVKAVVIRVDSPGGSALASDLMWREIRSLSKEKPVVASMVDVAASGGYYIAMACDEIVAEELTITGSIGVVSSKFNAAELNEKAGVGVDSISRGRYAEVLSTSRAFTAEEDEYFAESAKKAYKSFITKAAASRNMTVEALHEVAQGRVWTGRQALNIGLVDHIGGLNKALKIAANLANLPANVGSAAPVGSFRVQTFKEPKSGLPFPFGSASASANARAATDVLAVCDDSIACSGLVSSETLGISPIFEILGLNRLFAYNVAYTSVGDAFVKAIQSFLSTSKVASNNWISEIFQDFL